MIQLIGGRLIQGVGSGLMNTAIFVCVAQAYSVTQRPRMFTYISTAWILPSFVGPPISAWLTQQFSWHWVFYAVVPLVVGGGLLVLPTLRRMMTCNLTWRYQSGMPSNCVRRTMKGLPIHNIWPFCHAAVTYIRE